MEGSLHFIPYDTSLNIPVMLNRAKVGVGSAASNEVEKGVISSRKCKRSFVSGTACTMRVGGVRRMGSGKMCSCLSRSASLRDCD